MVKIDTYSPGFGMVKRNEVRRMVCPTSARKQKMPNQQKDISGDLRRQEIENRNPQTDPVVRSQISDYISQLTPWLLGSYLSNANSDPLTRENIQLIANLIAHTKIHGSQEQQGLLYTLLISTRAPLQRILDDSSTTPEEAARAKALRDPLVELSLLFKRECQAVADEIDANPTMPLLTI